MIGTEDLLVQWQRALDDLEGLAIASISDQERGQEHEVIAKESRFFDLLEEIDSASCTPLGGFVLRASTVHDGELVQRLRAQQRIIRRDQCLPEQLFGVGQMPGAPPLIGLRHQERRSFGRWQHVPVYRSCLRVFDQTCR